MTDPMKRGHMSPDSVFWLGRAGYRFPAISVKVRESLVQIPADCTIPSKQRMHQSHTNVNHIPHIDTIITRLSLFS